ncbi:13636_t:CDS:2, partial [Gigaspora margarita]
VERLDDSKLKDYFDIISYHYSEILCENTGCLIKDSNFYMCYKFNKSEQNVCLFPEKEAALSDNKNNRNGQLDNRTSYFLETEFFVADKQTGLQVYISNGSIKLVYTYNASIKNSFELAKIIANELRQQNEEEKAKNLDVEFKDIKDELDDGTVAQKIRESNLQNNQKNELQLLCNTRLKQLQEELYKDNVNMIERLNNIDNLNN